MMKAIRKEETRTEQEHYQGIADMIDTYADVDKKFMLWYLLGNMRSDLNKAICDFENKPVKDVTDYAVRRMTYDHYRWSEDMRNVLQEEIF